VLQGVLGNGVVSGSAHGLARLLLRTAGEDESEQQDAGKAAQG
jgi:hypothetical protein